MKESTRRCLATELVIVGALLIGSLAILFAAMQLGLYFPPKFTLPLLYLARWVVWGVNYCRARAELRPLVRRCAHYSGVVLVLAGLMVVFVDLLRSRTVSSYEVVLCIVLCFLGSALIVWTNKEFADSAPAEPMSGQASSNAE